MNEPRPALVDSTEMARLLGVSKDTVYLMARLGEIPSVRVGRVWRFQPEAVVEHLAHTPVHLARISMPGQPVVGWGQSRRSTSRPRKA